MVAKTLFILFLLYVCGQHNRALFDCCSQYSDVMCPVRPLAAVSIRVAASVHPGAADYNDQRA